jgi:TRAP-type C4-dicarboxylate transport system permease small subunit
MNIKQKPLWIRIGQRSLDVVEIYIPAGTFLTLFIAFLIQIFYRYFIVPLTWPMELSLFCYIWTILFGVCYALRDDAHITFDLIYDKAKSRGKLIMAIAGDFLILASFSIAFYPSLKYVQFMGFKKSNVLLIPMNWAYSPFLVFMIIVIGRYGYKLYRDCRSLIKGGV